jgi:hypothetical protein
MRHLNILIFIMLFYTNAGAQSLIKYIDPLIGTAPANTISARRHKIGRAHV